MAYKVTEVVDRAGVVSHEVCVSSVNEEDDCHVCKKPTKFRRIALGICAGLWSPCCAEHGPGFFNFTKEFVTRWNPDGGIPVLLEK